MLIWGYTVWKEKRERNALAENRERWEKEWLASPEVQRLVKFGPDDEVGKQVFDWLQRRQGKSVRVEYGWAEVWVVEPPHPVHGMRGPAIEWKLPHSNRLTLPPQTFHEVAITGDEMTYTLGWAVARHRGETMGLTPANSEADVEDRHTWKFTAVR